MHEIDKFEHSEDVKIASCSRTIAGCYSPLFFGASPLHNIL